MGQKVNPISNRLGIVKGWDSNWFGGKDFGDNLVEDQKIRKYLNERLAKASISKIVIERPYAETGVHRPALRQRADYQGPGFLSGLKKAERVCHNT